MDWVDGIVIGAAASVIGTIIATKVLNLKPVGGDTPAQAGTTATTPKLNTLSAPNPQFGRPQPLAVVDTPPTHSAAAPLQQTNPITEAAYNQSPTIAYEPAFNTGFPNTETVLPI